MIKTIEVGFPGGKRVDAIIDGRTIQTDQRAEKVGEGSAPEENRDSCTCSVIR